ncbi:MAG TPA: aldo/keto reductase [Gemmatimonadales bacterium]
MAVRTRPLGPGAPAVSILGYGGMPLSITGRPPEAQAIRAIHTALDCGATLIDTADVYCLDDGELGHNERLIAEALKQWSGSANQVMVATKGGSMRPAGRWERNGRPEHLRRACDRSLAALGVERIDLYQLHAPDPRVPLADSVGTLAQLQAAGKVRWVGLSNMSVREIQAARAVVEITTVQNRLSPFFKEAVRPEPRLSAPGRPHPFRHATSGEGDADRSTDVSVVDYCAAEGIGFLAYSPVGGGRLNLRLAGHAVVSGIARRLDVSAHAVTLAWVLAQGRTVIPIPGGRTPEHVRDAMGAGEVALAPEDLKAIDGAAFPVGA